MTGFPSSSPRLVAAALIAVAHLAIGALAEAARQSFDLAGASRWLLATLANVPVWSFALPLGGAYALVSSVRGRWLVWLLSLVFALYVALEFPAARYFGLHLSWPMLADAPRAVPIIWQVRPKR